MRTIGNGVNEGRLRRWSGQSGRSGIGGCQRGCCTFPLHDVDTHGSGGSRSLVRLTDLTFGPHLAEQSLECRSMPGRKRRRGLGKATAQKRLGILGCRRMTDSARGTPHGNGRGVNPWQRMGSRTALARTRSRPGPPTSSAGLVRQARAARSAAARPLDGPGRAAGQPARSGPRLLGTGGHSPLGTRGDSSAFSGIVCVAVPSPHRSTPFVRGPR
jgi:hypothetical protein